VLFEPQKRLYNIIKQKIYNSEKVFNVGLSDVDGELELNLSSIDAGDGASSSFLKPAIHLTEHPHITFTDVELCKITTLDKIFTENNMDVSQYNYLDIDVQGYEMEVFKGSVKTLNHIDYIISEINRDEVYENCSRVEELDVFLKEFGFERVETNWEGKTWGDALYIKNKTI
jgi:FkbM family methyltransferase